MHQCDGVVRGPEIMPNSRFVRGTRHCSGGVGGVRKVQCESGHRTPVVLNRC